MKFAFSDVDTRIPLGGGALDLSTLVVLPAEFTREELLNYKKDVLDKIDLNRLETTNHRLRYTTEDLHTIASALDIKPIKDKTQQDLIKAIRYRIDTIERNLAQ